MESTRHKPEKPGPEPTGRPEFIPTRRSLLSRLRNLEDQESWREFFDTYWRLIYSVAVKSGLNATEAQEVVQETIITVSRHMPGFHYDPQRGSFKAWLLQITRCRIIDQIRKRPPAQIISGDAAAGDTTRTPLVERIPDPAGDFLDAVWDHEWEQNLVDTAIASLKGTVDPLQYQIFDLHVLRHWPAKKVAQKLDVSLGKVYFAKYKISNLLERQIKRLEKRMR